MLSFGSLFPEELLFDDNGFSTHSSLEQKECEESCKKTFHMLSPEIEEIADELVEIGIMSDEKEIVLMREKHVQFLMDGLNGLSPGFVCLDASRPWILYWIINSLSLLDALPTPEADMGGLLSRCISSMAHCQCTTGGFGGGPLQLAHCAPTYAAVLSLLIIGTEESYTAIDRPKLYQWFMAMKDPSGGFKMHDDGEVDVRGTYTVIAIATLLNILTPEMKEGVAEFAASCQTYEGGMGGEPFNEAHGGYVFCGLASLIILDQVDLIDLDSLEYWLVNRQMKLEGGFQGRTNKLVDGCYSFWQGSTIACLDYIRSGRVKEIHQGQIGNRRGQQSGEATEDGIEEVTEPVVKATPLSGNSSFNQYNLQKYILYCAQQSNGGLRDKPGKSRDFYHTCYNLSGLSVAQHALSSRPVVFGSPTNLLKPTHVVFNICEEKVYAALNYFLNFPNEDSILRSAN
mmetsp:Transcript_21278/g.26754  ORF Transcript_21278/g.26754 Transcript_21278/m.26754 type:complete len:457 (-) Transcript_21278:154-1524(-)